MVVSCGGLGIIDGKLVFVLVELSVSFLEIVVVEFLLSNSVVSFCCRFDIMCWCMQSDCWCWRSCSADHFRLVFEV